MPTVTRIVSLLLVVLFINCCTTSKEVFYSYSIATYIVDSTKKPLYYNNLISYGDYLLEFRTKTNMRTEVYEDSSGSTSIDYDTIGVYLLSGINKLFYEFDTFALENKLIKIGRLEDKPFGQNINVNTNGYSSNLSFAPPKKVEINNIPCFITEVISNDKSGNDSINEKILLIKKPKFNSLYKIKGLKFPDNSYCIIGFQISDLKQKQSFLQEIESLRPLNEKEKKICKSMITACSRYDKEL